MFIVLRVLLIFAVISVISACYRETGISDTPVIAARITADNTDLLPQGADATSRIGDYVIQNSNLSVMVNGDFSTKGRDLFGIPAAGSITDFSTRQLSFVTFTLVPRHDDGINQVSQSVNMNRNTPIRYENIRIQQIDESTAALHLVGAIYDLDGSLAAAGASVDAATGRVQDCLVETTFTLREENRLNNTQDSTFRSAKNLEMTTVVTNQGDNPLPIFTLNDVVNTSKGSSDTFIPYPNWGINKPNTPDAPRSFAYAPYVMMIPTQDNTARYGWFSRVDGLVLADYDEHAGPDYDYLMVGKIATRDNQIPANGAMTFIRDMLVTDATNNVNETYDAISSLLARSESTYNMLVLGQIGGLTGSFVTFGAQGEYAVFEYINDDFTYFNGTEMVQLGPDQTFPFFGDTRPITGASYSIAMPTGQLAIAAKTVNNDPIYKDKRTVAVRDENGDVVTDADGNVVTEEIDILIEAEQIPFIGSIVAGISHFPAAFSVTTPNARGLMGRMMVEPREQEFLFGTLPRGLQGKVFYINSPNSVTDTTRASVSAGFLKGEYDLLVSRGPLGSLDIFPLRVFDEEVEDTNNPGTFITVTSVEPETHETTVLDLINLPNYLSADFGVRSKSDSFGLIDRNNLFGFAYAEDIQVLFFADNNTQPFIEDGFQAYAEVIGGVDENDRDDNVDSLLDEIAVERTAAVLSPPTAAHPNGQGRFAVLNLPNEEERPYLQLPLFDEGPADFFDDVRREFQGAIIHVTRPRAPIGAETGLFTLAALAEGGLNAPITADNSLLQETASTGSSTRNLDFDLVQILVHNYYDEYLLARQDWFNLLNAGIFKPATGGSTALETKDIPIGAARTWVATTETTLRDNDLAAFWESARAGNMFVSNGPIIEATIGGANYGGSASATGGTVNVNVKVSAAYWIPVNELRVVMDGQVVETLDLSSQAELVRHEGTLSIPVTSGSHWIVLEAGATLPQLASPILPGQTGSFGRVYPGHQPIAFTNPVFINAQ